jgi:alpha-tubulin suppressor-like RCC1 family protein
MRASRLIPGFVIPLAVAVAAATGATGGPAFAATGANPARATPAATTSVMTWGDNSAGELGNGTLAPRTTPVAVGGSGGIRAISSGGRHVLALTSSGTVLAWGNDTAGQLGNDTASANHDAENPATVKGLTGVTQVSAGAEHSLALLSNGTVEAWGDNSHGELGNGTTTSSAVPVPVTGLAGVKFVAAGQLFSVAVLNNGTVEAWGDGGNGQLGDGTDKDSDVPVVVKGLTGVTAVAAGGEHVLALKSDGTAEAWGDNIAGQLGNGAPPGSSDAPVKVKGLTGAVAISAGQQFSLALLSNGQVMGWGDNGFNQLGQFNGFPGGIGSSNVPVQVPGLAHVTAISAGGSFGLALLAGGTVDGWGDGAFGQLGNGTTNTLTTPTAVSGLTAVSAISAGGASSAAVVAAAAPAPPTPVRSIWQAEATVNLQATQLTNSTLAGVSASGPNDAWAVGNHSDTKAFDHPLAEHRVGGTWTQVRVPQPAGQEAILSGVDDISPGNAWAVGTSFPASNQNARVTLIEHWNGTRWSIVPSPNPASGTPGDSDTLTSISGTGPDDLWAAGWDSNAALNTIQLLFEHWNGTAWTAVTSPTPIGSFQFASGITAVSPSNVWAVGKDETRGASKTLSAHWNGTAWSIVPTPNITHAGDAQNQLTGVSSDAAGDVWASGFADNVNGQNFRVPFVLQRTGSTWVLTRVPNPGSEGSSLNGIQVLSPTDIWSAGATEQTDGGQLALTERFNGTSWSISPAANPGQLADLSDNVLLGVASSAAGSLLVVGGQEIPGQGVLRTLALTTTKG